MGSLAGAAHLLKHNTDDLRSVQCELKSHVEFKCIRWLYSIAVAASCTGDQYNGALILISPH